MKGNSNLVVAADLLCKVKCGVQGSLLFLGAGTRILVLLALSYGSTEVTG